MAVVRRARRRPDARGLRNILLALAPSGFWGQGDDPRKSLIIDSWIFECDVEEEKDVGLDLSIDPSTLKGGKGSEYKLQGHSTRDVYLMPVEPTCDSVKTSFCQGEQCTRTTHLIDRNHLHDCIVSPVS